MATKFGRYDLLERISAGGMAEVFKASIPGAAGIEKIVAIKRILPQFCDDERFVGMFIEEARISANLNHTNIGQVYEFGEIDGRYYIAMEYIPGKDLASLQEHFAAANRVMPLPMALRIIIDVCAGLHHAHTKVDTAGQTLRIVHRDVSPPNVLVSYEGAVKLIDFGIAKAMARSSKTATGLLKGKYGYLSPEQAEGKEIDHRSDLFSLGTVLHELVTGRRLFVGESDMAALMAVRSAPIPIPSEVNPGLPEELDHVAMTALERDRDHRYQRALDFYVALESLVNQARLNFGTVHLGTWMAETFGYGKATTPIAKPMAGGFKHIISLQPEPALVTGVRPRPTPPAEPPREPKLDAPRKIERDTKRTTPQPAREEPGETRITSESADLAAMLARSAPRPAFDEDTEGSITARQRPGPSEETRGRGVAPPRPASDPRRRASTEPARRLTPTGEPRRSLTPTGEPRRSLTPTGEPSRAPTPTGEPSRAPTPTGEPRKALTPTAEQRARLTPASGPHRLPQRARAGSRPLPILDPPPLPPDEEPSLDSAAITLKPGMLWAKPSSASGLQHSPTALGVGRAPLAPDLDPITGAELELPTDLRSVSPARASEAEEVYAALEVDAGPRPAPEQVALDQTAPAPERPLPTPPEVPAFDALAPEDGSSWEDVTSDLANPAMADRLAVVEQAIREARAQSEAQQGVRQEPPDLDATAQMPALDDATAQMPAWAGEDPGAPGGFDDLPTSVHLPEPEAPAAVPEVVVPISAPFVSTVADPGWDSIRTRGAPTEEPTTDPVVGASRGEVRTPEELPAFALGDQPFEDDTSSDAIPTAPRPVSQPYQPDQRSDEIPMPARRSEPAAPTPAPEGEAEEFGDEPTRVDPPGSSPDLVGSLAAEPPLEAVQVIHPQDLEGDLQPAPPRRPGGRRTILLLLAILTVLATAAAALVVLIAK